MTLPVRAFLVWLLLLTAMMANGIVRVAVLQPRLGEQLARQAATFVGIGLIFALTAAFVRRLGAAGAGDLWAVGALWLALTLAFEFLFGRYVSGLSWQALLDDWKLHEGRLWPLALLATFLAPWLCGRALGLSPRAPR